MICTIYLDLFDNKTGNSIFVHTCYTKKVESQGSFKRLVIKR